MRKVVITGISLILFPLLAFTQMLEPVKWSFRIERQSSGEAILFMTAKVDKGWHLYSQDIPENGPIPTAFTFTPDDAYSLTGKMQEPKAIEEYDPYFEMVLKYFTGAVTFQQSIKILTSKPFTVAGSVEYMSCDSTRCLPPTEVEFTLSVPGEEAAAPEIAAPGPAGAALPGAETSSLWLFFVVALLAGFAGALTPCVYPMIPMTVNFFMSSSKSKIGARINALFYGLSIIVIYTLVGVLVTVLFGSDAIKDVSSHWITNIIFFLLFTAFAASFFGLFEIVLPSKLTNKSDRQVDKGGLIGTFFMALTLVLVSFSCTAPFIGGILVEASSGSILKPTIGMFGFSLAFALPFTILAFFPSWLHKMPKSGGWLNSVKIVLGFIILALGMKFLLVPNQALGWGITREFFIAVWIVLFTLLGFYLLGKIKFSHDSDVPFLRVPRLLFVIASFTFVVYLLPGMIGAPLKAVSGFLPSESSFNLMELLQENKGNVPPAPTHPALCEEPKYQDLFRLPYGLNGYFDYDQGMACARKMNKPVLIDFTGHGCVNCKVMEKTVWPDPEVLKRLKEYIIIALYVDDRTALPEPEWYTSTADGKVKKTIGKKNADYQITRFNMNAQPYYILQDTSGNLLTSPRAFNQHIEGFIRFLDEGLTNFAQTTK